MGKIIELLVRVLVFFSVFIISFWILDFIFGDYLKSWIYHIVLWTYNLLGFYLSSGTIKLMFMSLFVFITILLLKKIKKLFS